MPPDSLDRYEIGRRELGQSIRRRRTELDLTIRQLSERCGMNFNSIVSIELGRAMPSMKSLDVVAVALDTTATRLLHGVFPWDGGEPPGL